MGLRVKHNLLPEQGLNVDLQENIQIDAMQWVVPSAPKIVNLSMKKQHKVKKETIAEEKLTVKKEEESKVSCKICDKELLEANMGKHTYKVHCLTHAEYQEIYGKLTKNFSNSGARGHC